LANARRGDSVFVIDEVIVEKHGELSSTLSLTEKQFCIIRKGEIQTITLVTLYIFRTKAGYFLVNKTFQLSNI